MSQKALKEGELRIYYKGEFKPRLDKALGECLKPFRYTRWASGYSANRVRDLAFEIDLSLPAKENKDDQRI